MTACLPSNLEQMPRRARQPGFDRPALPSAQPRGCMTNLLHWRLCSPQKTGPEQEREEEAERGRESWPRQGDSAVMLVSANYFVGSLESSIDTNLAVKPSLFRRYSVTGRISP